MDDPGTGPDDDENAIENKHNVNHDEINIPRENENDSASDMENDTDGNEHDDTADENE